MFGQSLSVASELRLYLYVNVGLLGNVMSDELPTAPHRRGAVELCRAIPECRHHHSVRLLCALRNYSRLFALSVRHKETPDTGYIAMATTPATSGSRATLMGASGRAKAVPVGSSPARSNEGGVGRMRDVRGSSASVSPPMSYF